jgi:hypothetical protein
LKKFDESAAGKRLEKPEHLHHQCSDKRKLLWEDGDDIPAMLRPNLDETVKSIQTREARRKMFIDDVISKAINTAMECTEQEDREALDEKIQRLGISNVATNSLSPSMAKTSSGGRKLKSKSSRQLTAIPELLRRSRETLMSFKSDSKAPQSP